MPNFKLFFVRFEMIRGVARILFPIMAVAFIWVYLGYLWWYIPLTVAVGVVALTRTRIPGVIDAAELLQKEHDERAARLLAETEGWTEENTRRLDAFLPERAWLARSTGSRIVAPVCMTAVLYREGDTATIRAIRFRLGERDTSEEIEMRLSADVPHEITAENVRRGRCARVRLAAEGEQTLLFLCRKDYRLEEFLNAIPENR